MRSAIALDYPDDVLTKAGRDFAANRHTYVSTAHAETRAQGAEAGIRSAPVSYNHDSQLYSRGSA
jgi:hypothetical protein